MQLLDGKIISAMIKDELKIEIEKRIAAGQKVPHLAAVLVGNNPASETYVFSKVKSCEEVGMDSTLIRLPDSATEAEVLSTVEKLNNDTAIDGFIVQLPLPAQISEKKVLKAINPDKDVDGFHEVNIGRLALGLPGFVPATPMGIIEMLKRANVETAGKHCVVLGRSHIVGMPISLLLMQNTNPGNCTVTICHSRTAGLETILQSADIIVAAIGKPRFVKANMVKQGAVVIDVGINRIADPSRKSGHRIVGDVDFDEVAPKCSFITPVPGGVGLMTIASLMLNTLKAVQINKY